jgi:hypothetical protein
LLDAGTDPMAERKAEVEAKQKEIEARQREREAQLRESENSFARSPANGGNGGQSASLRATPTTSCSA